jgi:hypothetical protein
MFIIYLRINFHMTIYNASLLRLSVKGEVSLCLNKHQAMKTYGGVEV